MSKFDYSYDYTDSDNYTNYDQDKVFEEADRIVKDSQWFKDNADLIEQHKITEESKGEEIDIKKAIDKIIGVSEDKEEIPEEFEPLPDEITIKIPDWYGLHRKRPYYVTLHTGVTVLVGKNGSGKTTFIKQIQEYCKENKYKYFSYSDLNDGRQNGMASAAFYGDFGHFANLFMDSEGQRVFDNFSYSLSKMGKFIVNAPPHKPSFILLDAIDSGLSINLIREIKGFINDVLVPHIGELGKKVYILITTNQYELTIGFPCIDVKNGKYITFKSYEDYSTFICKQNRRRKKSE